MSEKYLYDEVAALERIAGEIHEEWQALRKHSSTGKKAWLTQMKNHYTKIIQADPDAAAELLATHEYFSGFIRKQVLSTLDKEAGR